MMKSIGLLVIAILVIDLAVIGTSYVHQTGSLTEARANIVSLEGKVSGLTGEITTLRTDVSRLQVKLTESEARASTLQVRLIASEEKVVILQTKLASPEAKAEPAAIQTPIPAPTPGIGPAAFTTSNLKITPRNVEPGNKVTVVVTVTNTGGQTGTYTVVLKIDQDDKEIQDIMSQDITLAAGVSQDVSFVLIIFDEGSYTLAVNVLSDILIVKNLF